MEVRGPRQLPDFRIWLMDQWRIGAHFDELATMQATLGAMWEQDGEVVFNTNPVVQREALPKAELWWVNEDMTALVDHSAKTLPETTLTADLLPADFGLVFFATPLEGTQSDCGDPIHTNAMVWAHRGARDGAWQYAEDSVLITSYHYSRQGDLIGSRKYGWATASEDGWAPIGAATWVFGTNTDEVAFNGFEGDDVRNASLSEDRRWLAATWLLASQPLASSDIHRPDRSAARRSRRADVGSDVRVVGLRPRSRPNDADQVEGRTHKDHDYRWLVAGPNGDGFWRQQAYGPGRAYRKPLWITPYEAGPKDKPLKVRETVRVLRGES
jgi:hypothetical protein